MTQDRTTLFDAAEDMKRTSDEMRVQLHLAVADAEDIWNEAQKRMFALKSRLDTSADSSIAELSAAALVMIDDVKQRIEAVHARHARHHTK